MNIDLNASTRMRTRENAKTKANREFREIIIEHIKTYRTYRKNRKKEKKKLKPNESNQEAFN
jgi:hypothetical protein